ncbi:MAG: DUF5615 family PIN-like protein [Isosphaeraceae bacterium]
MKIAVDENIPLMTLRALMELGHDLLDIRGTEFEGISDTELWALAQQEKRLLITTDKGFTQYRTARHHGILIILLSQANRDRIHQRVMQALSEYSDSQWHGRLVVMRDVAKATWLTPDDN